jgi:SSS family solute:Na+ symporter
LLLRVGKLGGAGAITGIWRQLPPGHSHLFNGPFTAGMALAFVLLCFLGYNGGTWNLAQRYIASPTGSQARKAAFLSAALYLFWPLVLLFPMWAAPLLFPHLPDPTQSYSIMAMNLLPHGLVGLVLASLFVHTMAMTTSDANIISAGVTRDILPAVFKPCRNLRPKASLRMARAVTVAFTLATVIVAVEFPSFGGILTLLVLWYGALVGPTSVPMILGLLPAFRHSGATAAIVSWAGGLVTSVLVKYGMKGGMATTVAAPVMVSVLLFSAIGWLSRGKAVSSETAALFKSLSGPEPAQIESSA